MKYGTTMRTAIFSGRFDPPNLGHVITINKLLEKYDKIIIVILDYQEREGCDTSVAMSVFMDALCHSIYRKKISIKVNTTHFGKISKNEIKNVCQGIADSMENVVYVGGNREVNKHISSLKYIPVEYIHRTPLYNSTAIREDIRRKKELERKIGL